MITQAAFKSDLDFRDLNRFKDSKGIRLQLLAPLIYDSALLDKTITVPVGFVTDLASIPQVLWAILPPIGRYDGAAVIHDYLYHFNGVTRAEADAVLKEAMKVDQVNGVKLRLIYAGVRVGGWKSWNSYRKFTEEVGKGSIA